MQKDFLDKVKKGIIEGESLFVEFKEELPNVDDLSAEICALANMEGGMIIFGIKDNGEIKGLEETKQLEEKIMNVAGQNILPEIFIDFLVTEIQNKKIAAIEVLKSASRPHQTNKGVFYIRVGTTKRKASKEELGRIYQDAGVIDYDQISIKESSLIDIDQDKVNQYFHQVYNKDIYNEQISLEQLFCNLKILKQGKNNLMATAGGLLLFGKDPQKFLPQAIIKLAVFDGSDATSKMLDKKEIKNTLPSQIDEVEKLIKFFMKSSSKIEGFKRVYKTEYPIEVIREVVVNAVAHRNYSIAGSSIRIFIFKNRIEIYSPGRLPNTITLNNMLYAQQTRNHFIVRVLDNLNYIEGIGTGIQKIIRLMKENNNTEPKFEIFDEEFRVTLMNDKNKN
ncbi:MAG: putative DNA binding domain-containing protein [Proteobacteria bacterium]|nr:putative DNA binding domain-containing protein [Pseudomonadota bacterium]MBU2416729.1 putative DNA binding domain-containing protein [Patescibacteria group bacterium]